MKTKTKTASKLAAKAKNPILGAVHKTAKDLHRLGFIDARRMRKFDLLCKTVTA